MTSLEIKCMRLMLLRVGALLLIFISLSLLAFGAEGASNSILRENTAINLGPATIIIKKGTIVSVLNKGNPMCVVSVVLPDGSPLITQVPIGSVQMCERPSEKKAPTVERDVGSAAALKSDGVPTRSNYGDNLTSSIYQVAKDTQYPRFEIPTVPWDSSLPDGKYASQTGTFEIPINNKWVPVVYSIPIDRGKIAASASNLIFYGPYPNEKTNLDHNIIPNLVKKLGCTVYSFQIEGIGLGVSDKPYWSSEAGWFDAALLVRDVITKKLRLTRNKLILFGYSGGGGMVMNFAGAYPQEVEAVAAQAPDVVPPFPTGNKIKWLLVVNRGDANRLVIRPFYKQLRAEKCQALYCETTPDRARGHYHAPSGQSFDLIYSFIAGILDQRQLATEGITDMAHSWPYAAPSSPLERYAISKTSDLVPEDIQNGDLDLLPSLAFTLLWSRVCPPEQNVTADDGHTRLTLNFPARSVPAGVILYYDNPAYEDVPREVEDINSLAEHGYLVVSTMTASPAEFVTAASDWVKSQDKLKGLHIHLVGNGVPGARFISEVAQRSDLSFRSLSVIDFGDSWSRADCLDEVTYAAKECGMFGFYSYSNSDVESKLGTWATDLVDTGAQDRGCFNVCAKPSAAPVVNEATRHRDAEDQALSLIKALIVRADAH